MSSPKELQETRCCNQEGCENTCKPAETASKIPYSSIPLPLSEPLLQQLAADAKDYALLHGAGMRYKDSFSTDTLSMAPFFLLPTPFPRREFEKVYKLQPLINTLMHRVAHSHDFLQRSLVNTIKVDDFTRRLWELYMTVREEGVAQPVSLALLRSDVMLNECRPGCCALCLVPPYVMNQQVEINTIAAGFGHLGPVSARIHKLIKLSTIYDCTAPGQPVSLALIRCDVLLDAPPCNENTSGSKLSEGSGPQEGEGTHSPEDDLRKLCCAAPKQVEVNTIASSFGALAVHLGHLHKYVLTLLGRHDLIPNLPENQALEQLCGGMVAAWEHYNNPKAAVMFVVEQVTYNICDQRYHEYELLRQRPRLQVIRRTLQQVADQGRLDDQRRLFVGGVEVGVVYYRWGYDPSAYPGEGEWGARLLIERSLAIKCPSIQYHLAGTKKVRVPPGPYGVLVVSLQGPGGVLTGPWWGPYRILVGSLRGPGGVLMGSWWGPYKVLVGSLWSPYEVLVGRCRSWGEEGDASVARALSDPHGYVLKPQREGGGNNVYGPYGVLVGSLRGPGGVLMGSWWGPYGLLVGSLRGPGGVLTRSWWGPYGVLVGSLRGPGGVLTGSWRGPGGVLRGPGGLLMEAWHGPYGVLVGSWWCPYEVLVGP
ncbi:glutathione synthetase [Hyalella azteca]|uniref:Glutathione synthetase n=1 Tax=Hyalella azteca TaxID=294128 RepID=A0A979FIB1_HYAAZ|nr:glutathione synthetase [Hyalella azteca]